MAMEQAAMLSHRLDVLLEETERVEREVLAEGNLTLARDLGCIVLDLRLAQRQFAHLLQMLNSPAPITPLRSLSPA